MFPSATSFLYAPRHITALIACCSLGEILAPLKSGAKLTLTSGGSGFHSLHYSQSSHLTANIGVTLAHTRARSGSLLFFFTLCIVLMLHYTPTEVNESLPVHFSGLWIKALNNSTKLTLSHLLKTLLKIHFILLPSTTCSLQSLPWTTAPCLSCLRAQLGEQFCIHS